MAKVTDEELQDQFETFGYDISDDVAVLDTLKEICTEHGLDAENVTTDWVAFANSQNPQLEMSPANVEQFAQHKRSSKSIMKNKKKTPARFGGSNYYTKDTIHELIENDDDDDDDILGQYGTSTSRKATKRGVTTPEPAVNKRHSNIERNPVAYSPASFSPVSATPSAQYNSRADSGKVMCSLNNGGENEANIKWSGLGSVGKVQYMDEEHALKTEFKYMFQKLADKSYVLTDMIDNMAEELQKAHNISDFDNLQLHTQEEVTVVGRILCDAVGKLNAQSVILQSSQEIGYGKCVRMDLSDIPQYTLFPGQIIAANGLNNTGDKFKVSKIHESVVLPFHHSSSASSQEIINSGQGAFTMLVASGPFTTTDSLTYEPLTDLFKVVQKDKPDVLVLMGPFVDAKQPQIANGEVLETFEDIFKKQVEQIAFAVAGSSTKVVMVPSQRDVHHSFVFPQPPFNISYPQVLDLATRKPKENPVTKIINEHFHFVSDPCSLLINGVCVGITSTDVLMHLGGEEISCHKPGSSDRLSRLVKHILHQHNYYPLFPPSEEINVDYKQFEKHCGLPCTPDILIIPSELRYFTKEVLGCVCVNPGRLAKGHIGGTYARMMVRASKPNSPNVTPVLQNSVFQIVKI